MLTENSALALPHRPDFLIVGAQKAGSTWIYEALRHHPQVFLPDAVELLHFSGLNWDQPDIRAAYLDNFRGATPGQRIGEKTPGYFWTQNLERSRTQPPAGHNPAIPESVRKALGSDVSIIVSLRHPVHRAISAFAHHSKRRRIPPGTRLRDVAHRFGILDIGFYADHLAAWEAVFAPEQILSIIFESEIVGSPELGYQMICRFLGISDHIPANPISEPVNRGIERDFRDDTIGFRSPKVASVLPADVAFLLDSFRNDMMKLRDRFGRRLDIWEDETRILEQFARQRPR